MSGNINEMIRKAKKECFGWMIALPAARKNASTKEISVLLSGYSRTDFIRAAEYLLGACTRPDQLITINPKTGKYYPMTKVLYAAKRCDCLSSMC